MRILIVEGDHVLANALKSSLCASSHHVHKACEAELSISQLDIDLLIISQDLPMDGGLRMLSQLRKMGQSFPILAMSSNGNPENIARTLDGGADDFLVKPFAIEELEARVRALRRRCKHPTRPCITNGNLEFDTVDRTLYLDDTRIKLSPYELSVIEVLFKSLGRIVSVDYIAEEMNKVDERAKANASAIAVNVHRLRRKISREHATIETFRGVGYRLKKLA